MFAKPRPKKSVLPPPIKKRKSSSAIEEITFDNDARHEYLTGFHKRKQQRIKNAQEEAAKKARQEKIEARKQARDDRKREVEEHVGMVNKMLRESGAVQDDQEQESEDDESEEWDGFPDRPNVELVDHEEEYIDEDRFTTVTVESVSVSRDGLEKPTTPKDAEEEEAEDGDKPKATEVPARKRAEPKPKKKKFRYENKFDRQLTDRKQRIKSKRR